MDIEEPWSWQVWHFALVLMVSLFLMFFVSKHSKPAGLTCFGSDEIPLASPSLHESWAEKI